MNRFVIRYLLPLAFALAAAASHAPARAAPVSDREAEEVRNVIVAQIEALSEDDADKVFQTTTPAVREAIGSSGRFLAMVRGAYPMVYRPHSMSFHKPEKDETSVLQLVEITDSDEKSWLALFALEQQPDKTWRISGCIVSSNPWQTI